jgi:membrane protein
MADRSQPIDAIIADVGGFMRYLSGRMIEDRCQQSAAALTWVTLFALVPLLTVFYSILSLVPGFQALGDQIQTLVFRHFVPSTGAEIQQYLGVFADQARKLTLAGTLMLVISAWLMLRNIEQAFNHIWRVRQHRRGVARFVLYWAILSLGPLLLGAGLLISTYLFSLSVFSDVAPTAQLKSLLLGMLPQILGFVTFTLIFVAVPNCRVQLRHAAIGGAVSMVLFEFGKGLFAWVVTKSSYTLIYGAFAALPLFLMWLYLSWLVLLAGAEFVYALANYRGQRSLRLPDLLVALGVLERLSRLHRSGGVLRDTEVLGRGWLVGRFTIDPQRWEVIRQRLLDARLLQATDTGDYVLGMDTDSVSLWTLYRLVGAPESLPADADLANLPAWYRHAHDCIALAEARARETMAQSLEHLFNTREQDDEAAN